MRAQCPPVLGIRDRDTALFYFGVLQFSNLPSPGERWQREVQPEKTHQSDGNVTDKDLRVLIIPRTSQGRMMKLDLVLQELNLTQLDPPEHGLKPCKAFCSPFSS